MGGLIDYIKSNVPAEGYPNGGAWDDESFEEWLGRLDAKLPERNQKPLVVMDKSQFTGMDDDKFKAFLRYNRFIPLVSSDTLKYLKKRAEDLGVGELITN